LRKEDLMTPVRVFSSFLLVTIVACIGCKGSKQAGNGIQTATPSGSADSTSSASADPSVCRGNCEGVAYSKIIDLGGHTPNDLRLHPSEESSLKSTMKATRVTGSADDTHIHADAVNGELVFTPEDNQDPTHVTGTEPKVSVENRKLVTPSLAVRVIASPAALRLLQERAKQP
jgi:hypothetical protein